jgi:hypothetical protein
MTIPLQSVMVSHKIIWIIFLSIFKVVLLSKPVFIPEVEVDLSDLSAAKAYVVGQLKEKYRVAMGLPSTPAYIGWDRVNISGWPAEVRSYIYNSWNIYAVQDVFYALDDIEMTPKVPKFSVSVHTSSLHNHMVLARLAMLDKLLKVLRPMGCVKKDIIWWLKVKNVFPDLVLTTTYFGKWTKSDLVEIQSKIFDVMFKEGRDINGGSTADVNMPFSSPSSSSKESVKSSVSYKSRKRYYAAKEDSCSSQDSQSIHEIEKETSVSLQKSLENSQTGAESLHESPPVSRIYPVQTRPLNVPVSNYHCTFSGTEIFPILSISMRK